MSNPTYLKNKTQHKRARYREQRTPCAVPYAPRHLAQRFGLSIETAVMTAEAAGLGERGR